MATYQFVKLNSAAQRERVAVVDGMSQAEAIAAMQKKSIETGCTLYLMKFDPKRPNFHDIAIVATVATGETVNL